MTNGHLIKLYVVYHKNDHWSTIFLFFFEVFFVLYVEGTHSFIPGLCSSRLPPTRFRTRTFRTSVLHVLSPDKYLFVQARRCLSGLCYKKGRGLNRHPSLNCYIIFPPYRPAPLFWSQVCNLLFLLTDRAPLFRPQVCKSQVCDHQVCKPLFTFSFLKPCLPISFWHFPHVPLLADQFLPIGMEFLGFPI